MLSSKFSWNSALMTIQLCVGVLWEKGSLGTCTLPERRKASTLWPLRSSSSPNCKRLRCVLILRIQKFAKTSLLETYSSGWAPAQKRDRNPVSSETPKHSQTLWLLLWRDQVSWNVLPVTLKYFSHPKWYSMRKSHSRIYLILEFAPRGEMYKSLQKQPKQRSVQSQYIFVNSEQPSQSNVIFGSQAQAKVKSRDYVG